MKVTEYADNQKQLAISTHSQQAGDFASFYQELVEDAYQNCFVYSRKRLDVWLERCLPQRGDGLRLLDVGCGTGHHLARLRRRGFDAAGVDGSAEMLEHARANNPGADLRLVDVDELPFPDGSFDFILCVEVLRYLPNSSLCIREMARVLKPGGVCLATAAPQLSLNGYWLINQLTSRVKIGDMTRLKQFFTTSGQLRREFVNAGFKTPDVHGVYCGQINWVERLTPKFLPSLLKAWEPLDTVLADRFLLREFSNMFLAKAVRKS
jgi:ubiquinone/menaquinone biosynthesis C-methylase UbiE